MEAALGFEALPAALHLHILSFLPLVERVRCAPVTRSWAALLADPAFWAELRFNGAAEGSVDDETLLKLCRRVGGRLRALDVSGPACEAVTTDGLCDTLATDGLGLALESLRTWAPADPNSKTLPPLQQERISLDHAAAIALAAACPTLASAALEVRGTYAEIAAALRILPGPGEKCLTVESDGSTDAQSPERSLPALAEWVSAALGASSVAELELPFQDDLPLGPAAAAAVQAAAARLAAALAAPERGVRRLEFAHGGSIGGTPLLASLCHALTAESPLTELSLEDCGVTGAGAADIAAALAPGRSRLRTLNLSCSGDLAVGGGGVALLSALEANTTLTELDLGVTSLGGEEAATALATSLRSNSTLRTLHLRGCTLGSPPEGIAPVLSALASSAEAPSICSLTALDMSERSFSATECMALGLAFAEPGCRLECLNLSYCDVRDAGGAAIARGLELAGAASRLRSLDLSYNSLGDAAAAALGSALAAQGPEGALRKLRIAGNQFDQDAAEHLAEGLRVNSSLETLDCYHNVRIMVEGAAAIARGIAGTGGTASGVKALSLAYCELGDAGAAAMLEAGLERNTTLTKLDVNGNRLGEAGFLALANWAAARSGCPPPEGVALPSCAPPSGLLGAVGAAGEAGGSTGGGGAQQQSLFASPVAARLPHASLLGTGGSQQQQPSPLTLKLSSPGCSDVGSLEASLRHIVERANAAAAAAGWRYGRRSALEWNLFA